MSSKITLHVETEHICGHIHRSIYHVDEANINVLIKAEYPKFEITKDFVMQPDAEQERRLELSGSFDKLEVHMCSCVFGLERVSWAKKLYRRLMNRIRSKEP